MTLRFPFPRLQLLSVAITAAALLAAPRAAHSQGGNDFVIMKPRAQGAPPQVFSNVLVTAVRGTKVSVRDARGEIAYDLSQIQEVRKAAPPEFASAQALIEGGEMEKALPLIKTVADNFKGLPTAWAADATAMLGNIYLSLGKLPEAEAAFGDFERIYAGSGSLAASVGKARLAAERKDFAGARAVAEPIVAEAMSKKNISRAESQLFGQAYFVLGRIAEGEDKLPEAMEHYCRTVAIFYQERAVVKEAQKRIDELRQKGITTP
ncbi:MAG: tetratricopeptide repeat protein [Chthoniobacteraceae bacterium]